MPTSPSKELKNLHAPVTALSFAPAFQTKHRSLDDGQPRKDRPMLAIDTNQHQQLLAVGYESGALELWTVSKSEKDGSIDAQQVCGFTSFH
jgi:hypothetical protein